jgi:hypothetical protein
MAAVLVPWSIVLALAYRRAEHRDDAYRIGLFACTWTLLLFTLLPGGRSRYLMPVIPLFALVAAHHLDAARRAPLGLRYAVGVGFSLLGIGLGVRLGQAHAWGTATFLLAVGLALPFIARRMKSFRALGLLAAMALLVLHMHGLYGYHRFDKFNYRILAQELITQMDEELPVVVDDVDLNPKRLSFHLETLRRQPVYGQSIAHFDRYYYVTVPDGGHPKFDWTLSLVENGS